MKRFFDIIVSAVALIVLLPILAVIAVMVGISLGGPIIFSQVRPGLFGKPFELVKFRTMRSVAYDRDDSSDEKRLTKFGAILRSASLDELPELWNVLKGDMSLVGPRPLLMEYLPIYTLDQARRHEVQPGITGWAQVNGRNASSWEERFALDVWYVDNHSFQLDLRILWLTLRKVWLREGITHAGEVTMPRFKGSER